MDDSPQSEKKQEEGVGSLVGIIIVVILLGLGGLYLFVTQEIKLHQTPAPENLPAQTSQETS